MSKSLKLIEAQMGEAEDESARGEGDNERYGPVSLRTYTHIHTTVWECGIHEVWKKLNITEWSAQFNCSKWVTVGMCFFILIEAKDDSCGIQLHACLVAPSSVAKRKRMRKKRWRRSKDKKEDEDDYDDDDDHIEEEEEEYGED